MNHPKDNSSLAAGPAAPTADGPRPRRLAAECLLAAALALAILVLAFRLRPKTMSAPLGYDGDAVQSLMMVKTVVTVSTHG